MTTPLERFLAALGPENYWKNGEGYRARCPVPGHQHNDANPSLSVSEADNGTVLARCYIGHTIEEISAAVGMKVSDLFVRNGKQTHHAKLTVAELAQAKNFPPNGCARSSDSLITTMAFSFATSLMTAYRSAAPSNAARTHWQEAIRVVFRTRARHQSESMDYRCWRRPANRAR